MRTRQTTDAQPLHAVGTGLRLGVRIATHELSIRRRSSRLAWRKQYRGRSARLDATMVENVPACCRLSSRRSYLVPPVNDIRERH